MFILLPLPNWLLQYLTLVWKCTLTWQTIRLRSQHVLNRTRNFAAWLFYTFRMIFFNASLAWSTWWFHPKPSSTVLQWLGVTTLYGKTSSTATQVHLSYELHRSQLQVTMYFLKEYERSLQHGIHLLCDRVSLRTSKLVANNTPMWALLQRCLTIVVDGMAGQDFYHPVVAR